MVQWGLLFGWLGFVLFVVRVPGDEFYGWTGLVVWALAVFYFTRVKYPLVSRGALWGLGLVVLYVVIFMFFVMTGARVSF